MKSMINSGRINSLLHARRDIKELERLFSAGKSPFNLEEEDIVILQTISQLIKRLMHLRNELFDPSIPNTYNDNAKELIDDYVRKLLIKSDMLAKEYGAIQKYLSKYVKKSELQRSPKDPYLKFCTRLIRDIDSALEDIPTVKELIKKAVEEDSSFVRIIELSNNYGAACAPFCQSIDINQGSQQSGTCFGRVMQWARHIEKNKISDLNSSATTKILDKQLDQLNIKNKNAEYDYIMPLKVNDFVNNILPKDDPINGNAIYHVALKHIDYNHAIGLRRIPSTKAIEFYDPNHGLFLFTRDEDFKNFMRRLLYEYGRQGFKYNFYQHAKIGKQTDDAASVLPDYKVQAKPVEKKHINSFTEDILRQYRADDEMNLGETFINILPSYIDYIQDISVLDYFQEKVSSFKSIFSISAFSIFSALSSKDSWQNNSTVKEIKKMFDERRDYLQANKQELELNTNVIVKNTQT